MPRPTETLESENSPSRHIWVVKNCCGQLAVDYLFSFQGHFRFPSSEKLGNEPQLGIVSQLGNEKRQTQQNITIIQVYNQ